MPFMASSLNFTKPLYLIASRFLSPSYGSTGEIRDLIQIDLLQKCRSHRKSMLKFVRAAFTFALEKRIVSVSPVPRLQFRNGKKFMNALTEDQAAKLLKVSKEMDHDWWRHWYFRVYTGMRNGESYALQKANVDLPKRQIRGVESWTKKSGFVDLTKTGVDRVPRLPLP